MAVLQQEKKYNYMTTIEIMSLSYRNKHKFYSLATILVFLFVIIVYTFKEEKRGRSTCENLKILESLSDIATCVGAFDILDKFYNINIYATPIVIPDELWQKVRGWLQEDEDLLKTATNQNVIHITNKVNHL